MSVGNEQARTNVRADGVIAVAGELTFNTVPDVFQQSGGWFAKANGPVTIDLSELRRTDSAGLALMLEWLNCARAAGRELKLVHVPEQMRSLIRLSGLNQALGVNSHT
ncbi:MAG: STAS domain-containing protein [Gammaproteobacteria bacterium]|nr:STAS domain-containing protein [Gammaproteobacteria bacterium]